MNPMIAGSIRAKSINSNFFFMTYAFTLERYEIAVLRAAANGDLQPEKPAIITPLSVVIMAKKSCMPVNPFLSDPDSKLSPFLSLVVFMAVFLF